MRTRWLSFSLRVLYVLIALVAGAFVSFGAALADERKPEQHIQQVAEEAADATAPIHVVTSGAQGQPCTFDALFAVMSTGRIRAAFSSVAGACDGVRATGEVTAAGNPPIVVDEPIREVPYPGVKLGAFADLPYDTAAVTFHLKLGTMDLPPITLLRKRAPVHIWLSFPEWPNKCLVNGTFENDPGLVISDNGSELKRAWFSAKSGEWGPISLAGKGTHNLKIETYKPRDGKKQWDEVNQVLTTSFDADCTPPDFAATPTVNCDQSWSFDIDKQDRVAEVRWFVNGQPVDSPRGNLGDARSAAVKARVTFDDGTSKDYDYTLERHAPCQKVFRAVPKVDCEKFEVGVVEQLGVASVAWTVNGQPVAQPKGSLSAGQTAGVHADVTFVDGTSAGYDYAITPPADCSDPTGFHATVTIDCSQSWAIAIDEQHGVQSVAWSANGQPLAQLKGNLGKAKSLTIRAQVVYVNGRSETLDYPIQRQQGCSNGRLRLGSSNQVECAQLPGSDQYGLIKYKTLNNAANPDGPGDWRLMYGEFSLDGTTWTRFDSKRFGFDPRAGDIRSPQWVNWTVGAYDHGVFTGKTKTIGDSLPGFDVANQATWRPFDYPLSWASSSFLPAGKPAAIEAIGKSIAACTPPPPPPPTPITVCIQGAHGPEQATFADGKIPAGVTVLERCEPPHQLKELTACTGWDVAANRAIFRTFTVEEEYERAAQEAKNRCRPPEAAGKAGKRQPAHANLRVRGVDADVVWLEEQGNFATSQAAQHRWNSKRIVSLHYFGKGRGLDQVQTGDEIRWAEGGSVVTYRVKEIKVVAYNGTEYGAPESLVADDGIMLMTCYRPKSATSISQTLMIIGERVG
jgi:LPXTG-site transpeptidase (sortase) family protein